MVSSGDWQIDNTVDPATDCDPFAALIPVAATRPVMTDTSCINPAQAYLMSLNSARSRQTMASFLNIIACTLGAADLSCCQWSLLRRHHIQALVAMLVDAGKAPATVNTYLSAIKGVVNESWLLKQMDSDACQHIKSVSSVRGSRLARGRALSKREIAALFDACEQDRGARGLRDAAILGVLLGCGLRRSEAVALNAEDIMVTDRAIRVLGKGNKERISYMPKGTWQRVQLWIEQVRGEQPGPLFTRIRRFDDVTADRLSDQAVYHILQIRQKEAGLTPCAPHDMRRTFASAMLDNGEDLITVRDAMGHASVNTTQKYDRRGDERLRKARDHLQF